MAEALGVAVLGSVFAARYQARLGMARDRLIDPARAAFVGAMHAALAVAVAGAVLGAVLVLVWLSSRGTGQGNDRQEHA